MAIRFKNLDPNDPDKIRDRLLPEPAAAGVAIPFGKRPGVNATALLYVPNDVTDGDTVTVGDDTFIVDIINTDTTRNTVGALDATSDPVKVTLGGAPGIAVNVGDLMRIENEILKVLAKVSTTVYWCARARCGTTAATHANDSDAYQSDAAHATYVPVGLVTTLTPAAFAAAFIDEFNNPATEDSAERAVTKAATEWASYVAYALELGKQILFVARNPGVDTTAVAEDFANSTDSIWAAATFDGGQAAAALGFEVARRVVTAAEDAIGQMHFAFPFTVRAAQVQVRNTNGVIKAFTGTLVINYTESTDVVLPASIVTIRNVGAASTAYAVSFASTDIVTVVAFE